MAPHAAQPGEKKLHPFVSALIGNNFENKSIRWSDRCY